MATGGLYGQSTAGIISPQSGSESSGLYGNNTVFGGTYFEWFIFQESSTQPATPTGGSWNFLTNTGTPPSGWTQSPPTAPTNEIWVSIALVNSKTTSSFVWSTPGLFGVIASTNVGTTTTGAAGTSASVVNSGTSLDAVLNFTIPRGDKGDTGNAATIAAGTTTTTAPGTSATVTNVGTSSAAVFDFGIPRGAGVNSGGSVGQVLTKASGTDYDTTWTTIIGTLNYQGSWDASTNTPTLTSSVGTNGYYYVVGTAGTTNLNGITDWQVGDWAIFNGSIWQKLDQTNLVTSVAGRTGAVTLTTADIGGLGTIATQNANNVAITGGLISNTTLSGATIDNSSPYLNFANGSGTTLAAGRMWYNGSTGSWNLGMGGGNITQQVGEELLLYGKATSAINDSPLQIVYQTGTVGASGVITFAPTVSGITNGDLIIGVATESIALNGFGRVNAWGIVHGITTDGTAYGEVWADNDIIWYNPVTGNPTKVKPVAPNIKVSLGTIIKAGSGGSGSFSVEISHGSVLGGTDSNVQLTSVANNNLLQYDATAGYWKNVATIPNSNLTNSSITFGATSQALGSTVSALNAVSIGQSTAAAGSFTTLTASSDPSFTSTGAVQLPSGTTAQQPTGVAGKLRFNTTTSQFEGYNGSTWASVGGAAISNDTTTATSVYPLFAAATSGTALTVYTSNAQYLFKPSTGELRVKAPVAANGIVVNADSVSSNYTIAAGTNGFSIGPLTINSGVVLTIASGQRHVVI